MVSTEKCLVVHTVYVADAANARAPFRSEHLERLGKLAGEGALILAAAYDDMSGGIFVFNLQEQDSVRAIIESDAYWRNGVWTDYSVKAINRVVFDG